MNTRLRILFGSALFASTCLGADAPPTCGAEVKVIKAISPDEYYPRPCMTTPFNVVLELTVGVDGRAHDAAVVSGLETVPDDKRSCVEHWVKELVIKGTTFPVVNSPCEYKLRIKTDPGEIGAA